MLPENNIEGLRSLLIWADFQAENWWFPAYDTPRTIKQIFAYYKACRSEDVEVIQDLSKEARVNINKIRT